MPIYFHAIKKTLCNSSKGARGYYASTSAAGEASLEMLTEEIEKISAMSGADIRGVLYALVDGVTRHLREGRIVRLGDLGSLRLSLKSRREAQEADVDEHSIKGSKIIFFPGKRLSTMLKMLILKKRR